LRIYYRYNGLAALNLWLNDPGATPTANIPDDFRKHEIMTAKEVGTWL
jgi:hypothetical protein